MEKLSVEMDVEKIRKESAIYRDLQPGSFLFEYRSKLNDAAFNIALENPTLISNKGTLLEQAKKKSRGRWVPVQEEKITVSNS